MGVWFCWNHDSEQVTPASSVWSQLCTAQDIWEQLWREASMPVHLRLSSRIVPVPGPKKASPQAAVASPQPSWRHTTCASGMSQASSHTVPHSESEYISTRPSHWCWPPTSLTIPTKTKKSHIYPESRGNGLILCWLKIHLTDLQRVALWWWVFLPLLQSHVHSHWGPEKLRKQRKAGWCLWVMCILRKYQVTKAITKLSYNDPTDQYRKSLVWLLPGHNTETQFKDTFQQLSAKYVL